MISGGCPYCDGPVLTSCAPRCPAYSKETCPSCGKEYWLKHSRWDPESMTKEAFEKEYKIDEGAHTVERKIERVEG